MFEPLLTQPAIITLVNSASLKITLNENISDFGLFQAISGHLGEFIVVEISDTSMSLLYRLHPFLSLVTLPSDLSDPSDSSGASKPSNSFNPSLSRSGGQGWRLFSGLGVAPTISSQQLRAGLEIDVQFTNKVDFSLSSDAKWQLVALEEDFRVFHGPRELVQARALVSRAFSYDSTTEQILLELSELENVRSDLSRFGNSELVLRHPDVSAEVLKLDAQLSRKKQWLSRSFNQSVERHNWQTASNQIATNDVQTRQLEYYRLLSTPAVNEMVHQLIIDEE
ncbi:hypothetical protein [Shewanella sp. UCD-KL12]|uniref:hypothetical protein n=1 Tax=Shewanella sp. UCD-KL12 TaxID=1917163 RepID=UPI000971495D|nr:hypothetical protein [Shewanella sp. UCD-KL12]